MFDLFLQNKDWILAAICFCLLAALFSFYLAYVQKKKERIGGRLAGLKSGSNRNPVSVSFLRKEKPRKPTPIEPFRTSAKSGSQGFLINMIGGKDLTRRLDNAGIRRPHREIYFVVVRGALFVLGGVIGFLLSSLFMPSSVFSLLVLAGLGAGFTSLAPPLLLRHLIQHRRQQIEGSVSDFIDLLVLCVEAGLTLEVALTRALAGLEKYAPALCEEMGITLHELRVLPDRNAAFVNLQQRTTSESLKYLVLALRQSEKYGTSISDALKAVAAENRKHGMLQLEAKAARMPALLSFPLIAFILPPVVALSAGPGFVLMMRTMGGG
jgi:tight adherence protein C